MANLTIKQFKNDFIHLNGAENDGFATSSRLRNINNFDDDNRYKRLKRESINSFSKEMQIRVPWMRDDCYSCGVIGLHEEINDFYETLSPTKTEIDIRYKVIQHIKQVVHSLWSSAKVEVFGSSRTGLFLPTSDIDIVVTGKWEHLPLQTLKNAFLKTGIKEEDISVLSTASVPLVRIVHSFTKVKVDVSFNVRNGVKSAKMIKEFIKHYPTLPKLAFVLKQFLVFRGLNEVYFGGMSSYTLTILIISFLQGRHRPRPMVMTNLGALLIEFFEHYGKNFNYEKVSISILGNGSYQPKRNQWESYLSIIDPLCEGNNIAKGTYMMFQIQNAFNNAFSTLSVAVSETYNQNRQGSILRLILDVDAEVFKHRQYLSENYSNIMKMFPPCESDSTGSDFDETVEETSSSLNTIHKKFIDCGNHKNKPRILSNNSATEFAQTQLENNFEKFCSPNKHAKQEWRTAQNRNRAPFNTKDCSRYRRNSLQLTKNLDR